MSGRRTITVVRGPGRDAMGDSIDDEPAEHDVEDCAIAPRSSSDVLDRGREGVIVGLTVYAPAGADVKHTDQIRIAAEPHAGLYDVDGEIGTWESPFTGKVAGVEFAIRRAEG